MCCTCCTTRTWSIWAIITFFLQVGSALWLGLAFQDSITGNLRDLLDTVQDILNFNPAGGISVNGSAVSTATVQDALGDPETLTAPLDLIEQFVDYVTLVIILPGVLAAVLLLIATLCGCRYSGGGCCRKVVLFMHHILALFGAVMGAIWGVVGVVFSQSSPVVDMRTQIETACTDARASLDTALSEANRARVAAENAPGNREEAIRQINIAAGNAATLRGYFDSLCDLITDLLGGVESLTAPGFFCFIVFLLSFFVGIVGCCCITSQEAIDKKKAADDAKYQTEMKQFTDITAP